jgi:hypothetical protein
MIMSCCLLLLLLLLLLCMRHWPVFEMMLACARSQLPAQCWGVIVWCIWGYNLSPHEYCTVYCTVRTNGGQKDSIAKGLFEQDERFSRFEVDLPLWIYNKQRAPPIITFWISIIINIMKISALATLFSCSGSVVSVNTSTQVNEKRMLRRNRALHFFFFFFGGTCG